MSIINHGRITVAIAALTATACVISEKQPEGTADTAAMTTAGQPPMMGMPGDTGFRMDSASMTDTTAVSENLKVVVDLSDRKLYLMENGDTAKTYRVAVGSQEWPTQTGDWRISQVVWNPEWIPPEESWAKDEKRMAPGETGNPLGRAQLVYDPPRTIHGTNAPSSIGKAVSHGSIRMTNETIIELAKRLMDDAGAGKDSAFYRDVASKRSEKVVVDLPRRIPISVVD